MTNTEHTFISERDAHETRRAHIARGEYVSLIAFDPSRNVYVFDVIVD